MSKLGCDYLADSRMRLTENPSDKELNSATVTRSAQRLRLEAE